MRNQCPVERKRGCGHLEKVFEEIFKNILNEVFKEILKKILGGVFKRVPYFGVPPRLVCNISGYDRCLHFYSDIQQGVLSAVECALFALE